MTARRHFHATYLPPPPPEPGKIVVQPPLDDQERPVCPVLHLTPEQAQDLLDTLKLALDDYASHPA